MGLTGTLNDGTVIEKIPGCEFGGRIGSWGEETACGDYSRYLVTFYSEVDDVYHTFHACEEHAQQVWDDHDTE